MLKKLSLALLLASLMGCATSSFTYAPPKERSITKQIKINEEFDVVWDRLVRNLASDFFVINNIEKNSRIINVSFSSSAPTSYVDCGITTRHFSNARGENTYTYNPADSSKYTLTNDQGALFNAIRTSKLDGRSNIYLAPSGTGSQLTVNTKYVVDVNVKYFDVSNMPSGNDNFTFDFSTKEKYEKDGVICMATGSLEQKIIDYSK
ncbi:MAG: hypothetical protein ACW7DS_14280 [Paraglaciecola chathamensis]|uniref:hypothetical protein n=1 Tax=Neptunomonas phycophila TaxID=1572645 RepID=UPI0015B90FAC|nr:hypothetical protein [Neptunomonas phycophila]QLE98808.1 hypothetical protein FLM49_14885 [Neptunomonas phycophila]